jgi:hypothetical protein
VAVPSSRATTLVVAVVSAALSSSCAPVMSGVRITTQSSSAIWTSDAISKTNARTAYDLVEQLRPIFLRPPFGTDPTNVYVDGMLIGGVAELSTISARSLQQMQFFSAMEAAGRYGRIGTYAPAIVLTTRK